MNEINSTEGGIPNKWRGAGRGRQRVGEERELWKYLVPKSDRLIGHNLCHPDSLGVLIEGDIDRKNWVGRERYELIDQLDKGVVWGGMLKWRILRIRMPRNFHQTSEKDDE